MYNDTALDENVSFTLHLESTKGSVSLSIVHCSWSQKCTVTPAGHITGTPCGGPWASQSPCTADRASWPRAPSASTARSGRASTPPTPPASCRRPCTRCKLRPAKRMRGYTDTELSDIVTYQVISL